MTPSPQQQRYYDHIEVSDRSAVVVAVAGAGKTTTLVHGCRLMPGDKFFGAFNKAIADEIGQRTRDIPGMTAGTFHSAGLREWKRVAPDLQKPDGLKVRKIFRESSNKYTQYKPFESSVCKLVSLAKQSGLAALSPVSMEAWHSLIEHFDIEAPASFAGSADDANNLMVKLANQTLKSSIAMNYSVIDFDDMIYAPILADLELRPFDWVMIDEAQDTNATRRALAQRMMRSGSRLVAVGDPHQAIYGFTGADSDAIELIKHAVNAVELPLTITYRCPKTVVAYAQQWVSHIQAAETAPDGEVIEAREEDQLRDLAKPGDAVLCRFTAPLVRNAYAFIADGIPAKIEGKDIGDGLKALANNWKTDSLAQLSNYLRGHEEREVARFMAKDQQARADALVDKVSCLQLLISKLQEAGRGATVQTLNDQIDRLFGDAVGRVVVFSTIHRSKGREWDRVVWLQTPGNARARLPWQQEQEINLNYVAATRAKQTLVLKQVER